jgi:arsenate reductase
MSRPRVLFLCTHNSARSQMAEGFLRAAAGDGVEVHSAGTAASGVNPVAIRVMAEIGINISRQESKALDRYRATAFDWVITLCDDAAETCPVFPGPARRLHWSLPDPGRVPGTDDDRLTAFRQVRDRIRDLIADWLPRLSSG